MRRVCDSLSAPVVRFHFYSIPTFSFPCPPVKSIISLGIVQCNLWTLGLRSKTHTHKAAMITCVLSGSEFLGTSIHTYLYNIARWLSCAAENGNVQENQIRFFVSVLSLQVCLSLSRCLHLWLSVCLARTHSLCISLSI
jgi:hypothetical protein